MKIQNEACSSLYRPNMGIGTSCLASHWMSLETGLSQPRGAPSLGLGLVSLGLHGNDPILDGTHRD